MLFCEGPDIQVSDLPPEILAAMPVAVPVAAGASASGSVRCRRRGVFAAGSQLAEGGGAGRD